MAKKSVPVAQGAVEVLEFKDKQSQGGRNNPANNNPRSANGNASNKGRGGRARGGGAAAGNAAAATNGNGQAVAANGNKADAT